MPGVLVMGVVGWPSPALAAPANDDFANAQVLTGPPASVTGSNLDASAEPDEPYHAGFFAERSVWYRWTAPADLPISVSLCGSDFDTLVAVYTGDALASLDEVASNDDEYEHCPGDFQSWVSFLATEGTTYQIAVDGYDEGEIVLELGDTRPPNDDFANAQMLEGYEASATGTNLDATVEPGEVDQGGHSVWYRWTAPGGGFTSVSLCRSDFDTVLSVYRGDGVSSLVEMAGDDDGCRGSQSLVGFFATGGATYLIQVDGGGQTGRIRLQLREALPGRYSGRTGFPDRDPIGFRLVSAGRLVKSLSIAATLDCYYQGYLIGELRIERLVFSPIRVRIRGGRGLFAVRDVLRFTDGSSLTVRAGGDLLPSDRARGTLSARASIPGGVTCEQFFGRSHWTARHR